MKILSFILGAAVGITIGYIYAHNYIENAKDDIYSEAWENFSREHEDIFTAKSGNDTGIDTSEPCTTIEKEDVRSSVVPNRHFEYYILSDQLYERVTIDQMGTVDYIPFDRSAFKILLKEDTDIIEKMETMNSDGETIGDIAFANGDVGEIIGVWSYNPESTSDEEEDEYGEDE